MSRVPLAIDPNLKLYATTITFHKNGVFQPAVCVMDSGSEITSITEELMGDLKISPDDLSEDTPVAGVTGIGYNKTIKEVELILPINTKVVKVQNVAVLSPQKMEKRVKKQGIVVGKDILKAAVPNLIGLDFLEALRGTLHISYNSNEAYIEW